MTVLSLKRNIFSFFLLTFGLLFFSFFTSKGFAADDLTATLFKDNSVGTKASQTLTVTTVPSDSETITIGSCVVTFTTVSGSTSDDLDCNGGASIDKNTGAGNDSRTVDDIATVLSTLTNLSDDTLGTLTASSSTNTVKFEDETAVTGNITFSEIAGKITSSSVTGVPPVAQVVDFIPEAITAANTEYKITVNGDNYTYTSTNSATVKTIVEDLQVKVDANSAVTCTEDDTKITCTADSAGTPFTYSKTVTPDAITPTFISFVISGGTDNGGTLYAKEGDNISITLNTSSDTWKAGNNGVFSIGTTTGLNTGNFTQSTDNKTLANKTYTILSGQDGEFSFTGLTFSDQYDNSITGFSSPYTPPTNIVVDTTSPVITFETDITSTDPVQSQTVNIKVVDTNPDTTTYVYGLSADSICNDTDTYDTAFTSETDIVFNTEDNNTKYICAKAIDKAGNISYLGSTNPLNIDITAPATPVEADLTNGSDLGNANSDNITNDTTPSFTVKCTESDSTLTLYDSTTEIGSHTCTAVGDAEITSSELTAGSHSIVYTETDLAGNQSPSSSTLVVTIDTTAPTIIISDDESEVANISGGVVVFTIDFSEAVYGFIADDITVTGGTAGTFSGSDGDSTYTLEVTPASDSTTDITLNIDADKVIDLAGNGNTAADEYSQEVDTVRPTVTITDSVTSTPDTTNIANPEVTFTFALSEESADFTVDDITVSGGTKGLFTKVTNSEYTLVVTSNSDFEGNITVNILADSFTDSNGNGNTAPSEYIQAVDTKAPVQPTLPADLTDGSDLGNANDDNITNDTTPSFTVKCTESNSTLTLYDSATEIGSHTCTAVGDAEITSSELTAGSHSIVYTETDLAGNQSPSSSTLVVNIDTEKPTIVISDDESEVANISGGVVVFTIDFSEAVYGFELGDITVAGGTAGNFSGSDGDSTYTLEVTPTTNSTTDITLNIDADKVIDLAGNGNTAADEYSQEVDTVRPTVTITDSVTSTPDTTNIANPEVTFTFALSEESADFTVDDITVSGGTKGLFTKVTNSEYTLVVTSNSDFEGNITVNILADSFTDSNGNGNTAPSEYIQAVDTKAPALSNTTVSTSDTANDVAGTQYAKLGENITYTVTYSETVTASKIDDSVVNNADLHAEVSSNGSEIIFVVSDDDKGEVTPSTINYTITDNAGNEAIITSLGTITGDTVMADGIVPSITEVVVSSDGNTVDTTATDYLNEGKKVSYAVTYSENVTASGITPSTANNITTLTTEISASDSDSDLLEFTVADGDNGEVTLNTIDFKITDIAGNEVSITSLGTITGNTIITDTTKPTASNITIASNNSDGEDPKTEKAKEGDTITLGFTSSETVVLPVVKLATKDATVTSDANNHSATLAVESSDTQGEAAIEISLTDLAGNIVNPLITATTDTSKVIIDTVSPTLTEITKVVTPSSNTTPSYTFSTDEDGAITYSGNCTSSTVGAVSTANNVITFDALPDGNYSDCKIVVKDATGNISEISVNPFLIDTVAPVLELKGKNNIKMDIDYAYTDEGVTCTDNATGCMVNTVNNLDVTTVGSYTIVYTGTDSAGNSSSITRNLEVITPTTTSSNSSSGGGGGGGSRSRALLFTQTPTPTVIPDQKEDSEENTKVEEKEIDFLNVCIEKSYVQTAVEVPDDIFPDVKKTDKNYASLVFLAKKGIIKGDGDTGHARLKAPLNRAEFSKLLTIARGEKNVLAGGKCERSNKFKDVDNAEWYAEFVYSMKNANVIHGYPDGSFQAHNNINLVEIYKTLSIAFGYITYEDANKLSNGKNLEWYVPYKNALIEAEVVPVRFARYSADHIVKRQDVFEILYNIVKLRD